MDFSYKLDPPRKKSKCFLNEMPERGFLKGKTALFSGYLGIFAKGRPYFSPPKSRMEIVKLLCWISLAVLFYCYVGYGLLVWLVNTVKGLFSRRKIADENELLPVTLIITAYNEETVLPEKIANTLAIDYPEDKLDIIFVTDGSSDQSAGLVQQYPRIRLLHQPQRQGKYAAIKRAMKQVQTPVVVFSDANTMLNKECIRKMVRHYTDPHTGGVAGEKKIGYQYSASAVGRAEGLYWQYESFMKRQDAALHTVVGAAGELFSIRTGLFEYLDDSLLLDDFVISMKVCLKGYTIAYEPGAFATELPSPSLPEEEKRKVRISAGAYQSVAYLKGGINIFRHPLLAFQFISRRLLRWFFCPALLIILLLSSTLLAWTGGSWVYTALWLMQVVCWLAAFVGWWRVQSGRPPGLFTIPFYFLFMNYCLVKGFFAFIRGRQTVLWEKSVRMAPGHFE